MVYETKFTFGTIGLSNDDQLCLNQKKKEEVSKEQVPACIRHKSTVRYLYTKKIFKKMEKYV